MMRTMTVEENLRFCANSRLPTSWSTEKKFECVPSDRCGQGGGCRH